MDRLLAGPIERRISVAQVSPPWGNNASDQIGAILLSYTIAIGLPEVPYCSENTARQAIINPALMETMQLTRSCCPSNMEIEVITIRYPSLALVLDYNSCTSNRRTFVPGHNTFVVSLIPVSSAYRRQERILIHASALLCSRVNACIIHPAPARMITTSSRSMQILRAADPISCEN